MLRSAPPQSFSPLPPYLPSSITCSVRGLGFLDLGLLVRSVRDIVIPWCGVDDYVSVNLDPVYISDCGA